MQVFLDAKCAGCGETVGWAGRVQDHPAYPKCGFKPDSASLEGDAKEISDFRQFLKDRKQSLRENKGDKFLFLDIDGVLNDHTFNTEAMSSTLDRNKVELLNRILRLTGARIVLTSAWRYLVHRGEMNMAGLEWLLKSHGVMDGRLAGITRMDTIERAVYRGDTTSWPATNERGAQISDWMIGDMPNPGGLMKAQIKYAVVDDLDLGISDAGHPFVMTDGKMGMSLSNAHELIEMLKPI